MSRAKNKTEVAVIELTDEEMEDYNDATKCFGNTTKGEGYIEDDDECAKCPDVKICKALCEGATAVLSGNIPEDVDNSTNEDFTDTEWTREAVLAVVLKVFKDKGMKPEVTSLPTRDKIFVGEEDYFVTTKRALKINRLKVGKKLGIADEFWTKDNKGIVVNYEQSLDFEKIVSAALDGLYIESLPAPEEKKVKKDLFELDPSEGVLRAGTEKVEDVVEEDEACDKAEDAPIEEVNEESTIKYKEESFDGEEFDKGEVVKSLQIVQYSNGFNEIRITSKANVEELLKAMKVILG